MQVVYVGCEDQQGSGKVKGEARTNNIGSISKPVTALGDCNSITLRKAGSQCEMYVPALLHRARKMAVL